MWPEWISTTARIPAASDHPGGTTREGAWGQPIPIEHIPCLVVQRDSPREVKLLQWNLHHLCWDDASGDDHYCDASDVVHWLPAPAPPGSPCPA